MSEAEYYTCTGCSCLCDDIEINLDGDEIKIVKTACRRGSKIFLEYKENRAKPMVDGKVVEFDNAIKKAQEIIENSENFAIYGMDTIPIEAQKVAIEIAKAKGAYIDNSSSYCLGDFVEMVLKKEMPTATFEDVKDYAYVIFYWGVDPHNSLPRHMSRYTYYPRGKKRQRGYEEDRYLVVADVRKSHTAMLVAKNARFIQVDDDLKLVDAFIKVIDKQMPEKYADDAVRVIREMQKADFNVIMGGLGLRYGLKGNYDKFKEMINKMNEVAKVYFIPAGCHANMRGFNEVLFEETGFVNKYSFKDGESSLDYAFFELLKNDKVDTTLIIGSDPVNSLPFEVSKKLAKINTIVIDPQNSFTTQIAKVVIPSAISGVEQGGTMVRSDGVRVKVNSPFEKEINDVYVLERLKEVVA